MKAKILNVKNINTKWPTVGFQPLKIDIIQQSEYGASLRSPYLWDWMIQGLEKIKKGLPK